MQAVFLPDPGSSGKKYFLQSAHARMQDAFSKLRALDKLPVRVIVDNETDGISSPCDACKTVPSDGTVPISCCSYISEFSKALVRDGSLDFDRICTAGAPTSILSPWNCSGSECIHPWRLACTTCVARQTSTCMPATVSHSGYKLVSSTPATGHGLSLLLEAEVGGAKRTLLFDGGPTNDLWGQNAARQGLDHAAVEAGVLSHWQVYLRRQWG